MEICWYCDYPVDVDESIEAHKEIHKDCLLELATSGGWDVFVSRCEQRRRRCEAEILLIAQIVARRESAILSTT